MAGLAECHVVRLILDQQIGLRRRMRLVASQAIHWSRYLARNRRIHQIRNRVAIHREPHAKLQRQRHHSVPGEVVFGKFYAAIKDGNQVLGLQLLRIPIGPVALQAQ